MGDAAIRLDALRRLVSLTEAPDKLSPYIRSLWREEWRYGNQTKALELGESLVRHPAATPLQRITFSVLLGRDYVALGNRDRAADVLKKVEAEGKDLRDTRGPHQVAVHGDSSGRPASKGAARPGRSRGRARCDAASDRGEPCRGGALPRRRGFLADEYGVRLRHPNAQ